MSTLTQNNYINNSQLEPEPITIPFRSASANNFDSKHFSSGLCLLRSLALQRSAQYKDTPCETKNISEGYDMDGIIAPLPRKLYSPPISFDSPENSFPSRSIFNKDYSAKANSSQDVLTEENLALNELLSITRPESVKRYSNHASTSDLSSPYPSTSEPSIGSDEWASHQYAKELGSLRGGILPRSYRNKNKFATVPAKRNALQRTNVELGPDFFNPKIE